MANPTEFLSRTGYRPVTATTNALITLTGDVTGTGTGSFTTTIKTDVALAGNPTTTTQTAGDNSTRIATTAFVGSAISAIANVLIFKGVIDASGNPNYPAASVGDVYKISVAGKIGGASGAVVEVGDTIYCTIANAGGTQAAVGADFDIVQVNIDGAVIGPASATDSAIALYNGTTGKIIKNSSVTVSGSTITASITGNAGTVTTNANLTGGVTSVGNAATVVTNANLTGPITSVGNATIIANSVNLPGSPTTTTQSSLDNSTKIATTAYVDIAIAAIPAGLTLGQVLALRYAQP